MNEELSFDNLQNDQVAPLAALQNQAKTKRAKEIEKRPELANIKDRANFENLLTMCELEKNSLLRGATEIFFQNFKSFSLNALAVLSLFFATIFLIGRFEYKFTAYATAAYALTFWIFFCYLRAVFLTIAQNYFSLEEPLNPLLYGLCKLSGFILIEILQLMIFIFNAACIVLIPCFYGHSLALPILVAQDDTAINALLTSREYVRGNLRKNFTLVSSGNFTAFSAVVFLIVVGSFVIKDTLIFWSVILVTSSLTALPIHSSYRFLLYKKMQKISGGQISIDITFFEKIKFIFWRIFSLILLAAIIFFFHKQILFFLEPWLVAAKKHIG